MDAARAAAPHATGSHELRALAEADCRKAETLLASHDYDEAVAIASQALNRNPPGDLARALFLIRGKAQFRIGRLVDAEQDFRQASNIDPDSPEILHWLFSTLQKRQQWDELVTLADRRLRRGLKFEDLIRWKVSALRALDRHEEALRDLGTCPFEISRGERARMMAILRCDIGDFAGALDELRPATTPIADAPHDLLGLRGWAHGHLEGQRHVEEAAAVYQEALRQDGSDLWYREGLAHAHLHLPAYRDEALREFAAIVETIEERRQRETIDATETCLAGWCCYRIGHLDDAVEYYAAALAATTVGTAAEFDYALILLAAGHYDDAEEEYRRILDTTTSMGILRRGGLLYVALFDLHDAIIVQPALASVAQTALVGRLLCQALESTVAAYPTGFADLATRLRTFGARDLCDTTAPPLDAAASTTPSTSGRRRAPLLLEFAIPPSEMACGLLSPQSESAQPKDSFVLSLECRPEMQQTAKALYVTDAFLDAAEIDRAETSKEGLAWRPANVGRPAWAACTTESVGTRILDGWAAMLVERASRQLDTFARSNDAEARLTTMRTAELAVRVAREQALLYQAALIWAAASGQVEVDLRSVRDDIPENPMFLPLALQLQARRLLWRAAPPTLEGQPGLKRLKDHPIVNAILEEAYTIGRLKDLDQQAEQALLVAAGVQALAPLPSAIASKEAELARQLESQDRFRLDSDSILLIGREPAFYAPRVLLNPTRPMVDCFAFFSAKQRYAESTARLNASLRKGN